VTHEGFIADIASLYADRLPEDVRIDGHYINPEHFADIATDITLFASHVIASIIDAGSERDAVLEALFPHVLAEVSDWGPEGLA
jgi:hypothetical protein